MPYKTDTQKLDSPFLDARVRLLPCQREMIPVIRELHGLSQRKLAQMFNVSKRTIQFILDPEKKKRCHEQYKERRKDGRYYDKEAHKTAMNKHRRKKHNTLS